MEEEKWEEEKWEEEDEADELPTGANSPARSLRRCAYLARPDNPDWAAGSSPASFLLALTLCAYLAKPLDICKPTKDLNRETS